MTRIDKRQARKIYNDGGAVTVIPNLANPYHPMWQVSYEQKECGLDFDTLCDYVQYYNAAEGCGKRLAYYIKG